MVILRPGAISNTSAGDIFLLQYGRHIFCRGKFIAGGVGCVNANQIVQPALRFGREAGQVTPVAWVSRFGERLPRTPGVDGVRSRCAGRVCASWP